MHDPAYWKSKRLAQIELLKIKKARIASLFK